MKIAERDHCVAAGACAAVSSNNWELEDRPVFNVIWDQAKLYVGWLSQMTGSAYRLLTEAEWEYAQYGVLSQRHS